MEIYRAKPHADLRKADLYRANLSGANLYGANLYGANLRKADLYGANLSGAILFGADLREANLSGANLRKADLYGANLSGASLYGADLSGANLYGSDLSGADLRKADLYRASLSGANLYGANLSGAKNVNLLAAAQLNICASGTLTVYKKCADGIVTLQIPSEAKRSNATRRKCRAEWAVVVETPNHTPTTSLYDRNFVYTEGEKVKPKEPFEEDRWIECGSGIHFYLTHEEAENHQ